MVDHFVDNELGEIIVKKHPNAKRCIARHKINHVELTVPTFYTKSLILDVFKKLKPKLLNLPKPNIFYLSPETTFETLTFKVNIEVQDVKNSYVTLHKGVLSFVCPVETNFSNAITQEFIRNHIDNVMILEAKQILPSKVKFWADKYNFEYNNVKINRSKSRWGSCSSKRNINLSSSCMLLPEYLIDFIILHELCHTVEMNHGIHFWKLLNSITNNRAKELTDKLKNYTTTW